MWVGLVAACSSSSGGDGNGGSPAVVTCNEFLDLWCNRAGECLSPQHGTVDQVRSQCLGNAQASIDCSRAVQVASSYPQCKQELQTASCTTLFPTIEGSLPAPCSGVILLQ
jgi:hypothetical protein